MKQLTSYWAHRKRYRAKDRARRCLFRGAWHNRSVAILRLFAQARESAGAGTVELPGQTVGQVLDEAVDRFGDQFKLILDGSKVWLNGNPTDRAAEVAVNDEVAVLPPVSGG